MNYNQLNNYIRFKQRYFEKPFFCLHHREDYIQALFTKTQFIPEYCCSKSISSDTFPFKVKLESYGSQAIILGNNRHILCDGSQNEL